MGWQHSKTKMEDRRKKIKKSICEIFKNLGLSITIECNMKIVNYLDVTLNLSNGTFKPYSKPDNLLTYINTESNHPSNIIKQIPINIQKRLSDHSSNEALFKEAIPPYQKALANAGYNHTFTYSPSDKIKKKNRKRNIIWFNPPYNQSVTNNIGKTFLDIIDTNFPKSHQLHKIFNRNTIKISYSCTRNIQSIINTHNKKIINQRNDKNENKCNCHNKDECPMQNECLSENIVYKASVKSTNTREQTYIGISETTFKKRYANHKKSFNHDKYRNDTELSKHVWAIKDKGEVPEVKWEIVKKCPKYNTNSRKCNLCLGEKLEIIMRDNLLNKRSELVSRCRHLNKHLLRSFDSKD